MVHDEPALPGRPDPAPRARLRLALAADYREIDVSAQLGADGTVTGALPLVRSRDIRVEVPRSAGTISPTLPRQSARLGDVDAIELHAVAAAEADPDRHARRTPTGCARSSCAPTRSARAPRTRRPSRRTSPGSALVGRLAIAADLVSDGAMLMGRQGERIAFGCAGLTHHAAPDASSIEFADPSELAGQWMNVAQMVLDRDWTWRGQGAPTVRIRRRVSLPGAPGDAPAWRDVGEIQLMNTINVQARTRPERGSHPTRFPRRLHARRSARTACPTRAGSSTECSSSSKAAPARSRPSPLACRWQPGRRQVPKVVAAGHGAHRRTARMTEYSATGSRVKRLWLEFDAPLADPRDAYFVRAVYQDARSHAAARLGTGAPTRTCSRACRSTPSPPA